MKKLLILIVAGAIYLHFFPNSDITDFYNEKKEMLFEKFAESTDTKARIKLEKIYSDLKTKLNAFSDEEITHLKNITSSRKNTLTFYQKKCKTKTRDYIFHQDNQEHVCQAIRSYESRL